MSTGCTTNSNLLSTCPVVKKGKKLSKNNSNNTQNFSKDAGTKLKTAALAYPNKAVEISGPVRGNIRHAQYNTPCCMYSDAQIANTLISQAAAVGADVPDATAFGNDNIQVDTSTPVYKMNKERDAKKKVTQSKSFQVSEHNVIIT